MGENAQFIFNVLVTLCGFLGGWVLNSLKSAIDHLHAADKELTEKLQQIEILVVGNYVKRDDIVQLTDAIFKKLDRIELKVDRKMDKGNG